MKIAFVTQGLAFNGNSLVEKSLGGSETALLQLSAALAAQGHQVDVFCQCDKPGKYASNLTYHHADALPSATALMTWDVFIVSRYADYLKFPTSAGLRVLWCHDILVNPPALASCLFQTDLMMLLSDYHIKDYTDGTDRLGDFKPIIWKTSNGVDMATVKANLRPKISKRLIFTSRPERGLMTLLHEVFPRILEKHPTATLAYSHYSLDGFPVGDEVRQIADTCTQMAKRLGDRVIPLGNLTKADLYKEISQAELLLYPTGFPEISCITAMEAAACGTPIITTRDFALTETVKDGKTGILIPGKPHEADYVTRFVAAADYLLKDDKKRKQFSEAGPKWIAERGYTWDKVAQSWIKKFESMFEKRWKDSGDKILLEMARHSDLLPAIQIGKVKGLDTTALEVQLEKVTVEQPANIEDVKKCVGRFEKITQVLNENKVTLGTVLDLHCGEAAFGLHLLKVNSKVRVTLADDNPAIRERVLATATKAGFADRLTVSEVDALTGQTFDVVHCGDKVDMSTDPTTFVSEIASLAKPEGYVVFTTRTGAKTATLRDVKHHRMWNFSSDDFVGMVAGLSSGSGVSLMEEGIGQGGEVLGHWVVLLKQDHATQLQPIDLEHRTRLYRPYVSVGVAMIARDAEDWVIKCLKAIRPYVDDIHIALDDRTKDMTMSLALEHGADEIWPVKFEDFSQMRNESVKKLKHDWIFWVDTDEILVDGPRLRRYLRGPFAGLGLKQIHLMRDVHGTYDVPIRLYRNVPWHRFSGLVHEHAVDQRKDLFNDPISPSMLIPDVDLLHYGYQDEVQRRNKCSNRNMDLLIRDVKENGSKGRGLSWILVMRDYLNIAKWRLESSRRPIRAKSIEHLLVQAAVRVFLKHFMDPKNRYHGLAVGMYQEALALLGKSGVPFEGRPHPPFEVAFGLGGAVGGIQQQGELKPQRIWFIDMAQYMNYVARSSAIMGIQMGICPAQAIGGLDQVPKVEYTWNENDIDLLLIGLNNIDPTTGRLLRS